MEQASKVTAAIAVVKQEKPTFSALIKGQSSGGFWTSKSRAILAACVEDGQEKDSVVLQALGALTLKEGADSEAVYLTLLAWYILEEAFSDYEDQWQMIVSNAKAYLEQVGVQKPIQLVKKFTLLLVE